MIRVYKIFAIVLLLFNGIGAMYGGWMLVSDPSGEKLQMPLNTLEHSPFDNFLIPGIILIAVNGIFSLTTLIMVILKKRSYPQFIVIQGFLLSGWIIVQVLMLQTIAGLHFLYGTIGLVLLVSGGMLYIHEKHENTVII